MSDVRYSELLSSFSNLFEQEGLQEVLGVFCDAISLSWDTQENTFPGNDAALHVRRGAFQTYQEYVLADYLFNEARASSDERKRCRQARSLCLPQQQRRAVIPPTCKGPVNDRPLLT